MHTYQVYCADHEARCLRDGRSQQRWTNPSSAQQFAGGPLGNLDMGAPRWKQRAFYDAMKDSAIAAGLKLSMARVSIYDTVDGKTLDDILDQGKAVDPLAVRALIEERMVAG